MNPELLITHFSRISDAPDAVPRLRRFILDLAVRGKLVELDPADEPVSRLLNRIRAEKERLLDRSEIPKQKLLAPIENNEIPFALPPNWCWIRLNDITSYIQRGKSPKYASGDGLPVISQKCVQWRGLDLESAKTITRESIVAYEDIRFLRDGDLLWNSTGTGTIGRIVKVANPPPKLVCDSHVTVVRCLIVDAEYVRSWLRSDEVYRLIEDRAAGSTNQVELTSQMAMNQVVPLPPMAEQLRIVAKVKELMALCDKFQAAQAEREKRRNRLTAASLHHLDNGLDAGATRVHAQFYLKHLPCLTARPEHIRQFRQTILNLAVRGQLVPQHPDDEPATELLKRIQTEIARSVGAGHTKERKRLQLSATKDAPFDIPRSWAWVTLEQITFGFRYGTSVKCSYEQAGEPVLRIPNIVNGGIRVEDLKFGSLEKREADELRLRLGDILMVRSNGSLDLVGRPALVGANAVGYCYAGYLIRVRISATHLAARYVLLALNSAHVRDQIEIPIRTTVGLKNVNATELGNLVIPLPPLAEQGRIVAKVDELMTLCDRLENQLIEADAKNRGLLEAVLYHALNDGGERLSGNALPQTLASIN
jgi:type I restriction enzyme S subunit